MHLFLQLVKTIVLCVSPENLEPGSERAPPRPKLTEVVPWTF